MRHGIIIIAALLISVPAWAEEPVTLGPGPERETVATSCSICHTLNYIRMNAPFLTKDGWTAEVTKMQKAYGAPIDDATAASIVDYLASVYGPPKS